MMILRLYTTTLIVIALEGQATRAVNTKDEMNFSVESGIRILYNNYKQCESDSKDIVTCLKLKAVKLADRALSINNIPITEGITLTKRDEKSPRSVDLEVSNTELEERNLPENLTERNRRLDTMLWSRIAKFFESRSLQFRINQLLFPDYSENEVDARDGRGKKDKNKGMYMYMMMMKGGMLALAYKGLALLAGKALLVSKIALTLALLVAAKKLFSSGHSAKTTYEIVKTPIITHSHQYSGGAAATHGHYGTGDFSSYDGSPYARSLDMLDETTTRKGNSYRIADPYLPPVIPKYTATHIIEKIEERSLSSDDNGGPQGRSLPLFDETNRKLAAEDSKVNDKKPFTMNDQETSNLRLRKVFALPYRSNRVSDSQRQLKSVVDDVNTDVNYSEHNSASDHSTSATIAQAA